MPLAGGRYVVACEYCDVGGVSDAGAVVWADAGGIAGEFGTHNALHGRTTGDRVGESVVSLANGNYVVGSPHWSNSVIFPARGAATWVNGSNGLARDASQRGEPVSYGNSLYGSSYKDWVGQRLLSLANGNFLVLSPNWSSNGLPASGAVTWGDGTQGLFGPVDAQNSLLGASQDDRVGADAIALPSGNAVVTSTTWDERFPSGAVVTDSGAVTWIDGARGLRGYIDMDNSLLANGQSGAKVGLPEELPNGDYVVRTAQADNCVQGSGCIADTGAITPGSGTRRLHGRIEPRNSVLGTVAGEGTLLSYALNAATDQLVVGRPRGNVVSLFDRSLFQDGFE